MKKPLKNTFIRKLLSLLMISTLFLSKGSLLMIQANEGSNDYDKDVQVLENWPGAVQQQSIMDNLAYGAHAESNMPTFKSDIDDHYVGKICDGIVNSTNHTQLDGNTVKTGDIWEITIDLEAENEFHLLAARFPNLNVALGKFTIKASADKENWDVISEVNSTPSKDVYVYLPEGATYRYIRLEKQFGANDKWSLIGEFEVYSKNTSNSDAITDFTGFPNYALKQKATMDKVNYPGHVPQNAVDGNSGTYAQEESGKPFELTIEFADPTKLNVVRVKALESSRSINSFKLSYTEDGNNWVTISERETNSIERTSAIILEYLDAPVTAKQIKFEVLDATIWFAISSLEVFNTNKLRDLYTSPMPGQIKKGTTIELMTPDEDVTIYYSTDGSEPTLTSSTYTEPITVQEDTVVKAFAAKDGYENSNVAEFDYYVRAVEVSPEPGRVVAGTAVTLSALTANAEIYYTTDDSDPKSSETVKKYNGTMDEIVVESLLIIRAYCKSESGESPVYSFLYSTSGLPADTKVTVSSGRSGNPAGNAIDENPETSWIPNTQSSGEWIKLDFGTSQDIYGLKIKWLESGGNYKYEIEVSDDDKGYRTFSQDTEGKRAEDELCILQEVNHCRYMKIRLMGSTTSKQMGIKEWEVYAKESAGGTPELRMNGGYASFDRVVVNEIPKIVDGVAEPRISLNGEWAFTMYPQNAFWRDETDLSGWDSAKVPGDLDAQGFPVYWPDEPDKFREFREHDEWWPGNNMETPYKRKVTIPADYEGKKVFLRIDKAFSYARVWVNGQYVRDHRGEYNAWDCDITDYVKYGEENWITISVTAEGYLRYNDKNADWGFLGMRHHRGILGDVTLYAQSESYANRIHVETDLDAEFKDATLKITASVVLAEGQRAQIQYSLKDPAGNEVELKNNTIDITESLKDKTAENTVSSPEKWDSEHPNLYTLTAKVIVNGKEVETFSKKIGFMEVTTDNGIFKVNGIATKLRGVNYYTHYGTDSISYSLDIQKQYLETLKKNNINYIRAAHFPVSTETLELCDELGIFVEQENSIAFVGNYGQSQSDTRYREYYLHTLSEMMEKDRSHVSIIMWSIANECSWGTNMKECALYSKAEDAMRPVKFSWGTNAPKSQEESQIDIISRHYDNNNVESWWNTSKRPIVWDEFAHGYAEYSIAHLQFDPGFREHYYNIIKEDWELCYNDERYMGGAIWDLTDWYQEGENQAAGLAEWGQIDVWGREKPEINATKDVYSPVQYRGENAVEYPGIRDNLKLDYENRYETVNFNDEDFAVYVTVNDGSCIKLDKGLTDIATRKTGKIQVQAPENGWKIGDKLTVEFEKTTGGTTRNVHTDVITIGKPEYLFAEADANKVSVDDNEEIIEVSGNEFNIIFSKTSGKITSGIFKEETVLVGGPHLNLGKGWIVGSGSAQWVNAQYTALGDWMLTQIQAEENVDGTALVTINGKYGALNCTFIVKIDAFGRMQTDYQLDNNGNELVYELGIAYDMPSSMDKISWVRTGYRSYTADDQYGRNEGTAYKEVDTKRVYGKKPEMPWKDDDKSFYNFGRDDKGDKGTNDFRGSKTNVYYAEAGFANQDSVVAIEGDGTGSVRAELNSDGSVRVNINNEWGYIAPNIEKEHYNPWRVTGNYGGSSTIRLNAQKDMYYLHHVTTDDTIRIESESTSITANGMTLQFNVADKNVKWEILNLDGTESNCAKIDQNGLVTPFDNGYAVVRAVLDENTGASAVKVISIGGQVKPVETKVTAVQVNPASINIENGTTEADVKAELAKLELTGLTESGTITVDNTAAAWEITDYKATTAGNYTATLDVSKLTLQDGYKFDTITMPITVTVTVSQAVVTEPETYTVTLNGNGGKVSPSNIKVESGKTIGTAVKAIPTPTRAGYNFLGWYTAKKGGTKVTTGTKVTKNVTLYAQWNLKKGTKFKSGNIWYKVIKTASANKLGAVEAVKPVNRNLTKVNVPANAKAENFTFKVERIGKNAFKGNKKLKTVTIGNNVKQIKNNAFFGCTALTKVTIGKGVEKIGKKVFCNDKRLKTITIQSKKLKSAGANTFKNIHKNARIKVPSAKLNAYSNKILKGKGQPKTVKIIK